MAINYKPFSPPPRILLRSPSRCGLLAPLLRLSVVYICNKKEKEKEKIIDNSQSSAPSPSALSSSATCGRYPSRALFSDRDAGSSSATGGPAVRLTSVVARKSRITLLHLVGEELRDLEPVFTPAGSARRGQSMRKRCMTIYR